MMTTTTPRQSTPVLSAPAIEATAPAPPRPIVTTVLPIALVARDIAVREGYLSDELQTICDVAGKTQSVVLIASAGQPLENREVAFSIWRTRGLEELAAACPEVREFLSNHADQSAAWHAGTIDLLDLDRLIHDYRETTGRERMARLSAQKQALRAALAKNWHDPKEMGFAKYAVVRGDGEMILCNNSVAAKTWGGIGNHGFYLIPLAVGDMRCFLPGE